MHFSHHTLFTIVKQCIPNSVFSKLCMLWSNILIIFVYLLLQQFGLFWSELIKHIFYFSEKITVFFFNCLFNNITYNLISLPCLTSWIKSFPFRMRVYAFIFNQIFPRSFSPQHTPVCVKHHHKSQTRLVYFCPYLTMSHPHFSPGSHSTNSAWKFQPVLLLTPTCGNLALFTGRWAGVPQTLTQGLDLLASAVSWLAWHAVHGSYIRTLSHNK